ncbi:MAG: UDP-N-acetylmuramoyl-tripeptide-D-alanyl-D-alanine ligase [candidate division TM6 bacterium GW2011_GWE2_36_25]|nr:MAG: UDP-N-acetylmuramoyl-tripeptide-D-alanyl-D-alanine ligase [candidate division TM6 bacterium GW2011_GWF2_36_131]KKQ02584.1 MAG: UDP-N-acetylmuramoyl-tripeptide-D-alanyl-D-alanine ligase [candidate division TM6 bacterium GW2011_GWE2_36_25]KKQ19078.1 MAG: UDP-N-acetylmuramoyl-tripeptide-D-alanyl-D-alanine ligase [candidate division TM6 bacterium GW2011_GWA2_36_9]
MFDKNFVASALSDGQILYDVFPEELNLSIDTRTLQKGDIFIAFSGNQADGHDFICDAFEKGAAGIIINKDKKDLLNKLDKNFLQKKLVLLVNDTYQALYKLAAKWRAQFNIPIVGITGSIGKTSTREMVANILNLKGKSFVATSGNYSSIIGLALSILKLRKYHEVGVFEVGISQRGDMNRSVDILKPTIAAIITVGHSHMEGLGSLQDIATEKRLIFKYFKQDSIGIVNGDQDVLARVGYIHPVIKFGAKSINQVQARKVHINSDHISFILKLYKNKYAVRLQSSHEGRLFNALAAASICYLLHIEDQFIVKGIQQPLNVGSRFEFLPFKKGKGTIIDDCYNASPESVKAALLALEQVKTEACKVAVLGDMLELGVDSSFWHRQIGRFLRKTPSIAEVILVGKWIKAAQDLVPLHMHVTYVESVDQISSLLDKMMKKELLVLVKGSHGMHLSTIIDELAQRPVSFTAAKKDADVLLDEQLLDKQISMQ